MQGLAPFWIEANEQTPFPEVSLAMTEPDGLLAVGADLSPERLQMAYTNGIFPWYNHDQPILWWSPNPRAVIFPQKFHISKSLKKFLKKNPFEISIDRAFNEVIEKCSQARTYESGTWITTEMKQAYNTMHKLGHAHSVEAWHEEELVGGLYGLAYGQVFFGESMFSSQTNASKVAFNELIHQLIDWDFKLVDCQVSSEHLSQFGAEDIPRDDFLKLLRLYCDVSTDYWQHR